MRWFRERQIKSRDFYPHCLVLNLTPTVPEETMWGARADTPTSMSSVLPPRCSCVTGGLVDSGLLPLCTGNEVNPPSTMVSMETPWGARSPLSPLLSNRNEFAPLQNAGVNGNQAGNLYFYSPLQYRTRTSSRPARVVPEKESK